MDKHSPSAVTISRSYKFPENWTKRFYCRLFSRSLPNGVLGLQFRDEIRYVGEGEYICTIAPPNFVRFIFLLLKPNFRIPEFYTKGYWACEDQKLYDFLNALTSTKTGFLRRWFDAFNTNLWKDKFIYRLFPKRVRENIAIHYNTSPKFMSLILGDRLEYTCAFFDGEDITLRDAQDRKIQKVITRLNIQKEHSVLDLGCGWGQIAESVALQIQCRVTGMNISDQQIKYASDNKSDLTEFINKDFMDVEFNNEYDRVYSIGMLEHVGRGYLNEYFKKIEQALKGDGKALVHCIVRNEAGATNRWIDEVVFPGAYIPMLSEVVSELEHSNLSIDTLYTHHKKNYEQTLKCWADNYYKNKDQLSNIISGMAPEEDCEEIMKIWEFYLCGSRLVFNENNGFCYNVQIILKRRK